MSFGQHGGAYAATDVSSGAVTIPAGKVVVAVTSLNDATEFTSADTGFPQINNIAILRGLLFTEDGAALRLTAQVEQLSFTLAPDA